MAHMEDCAKLMVTEMGKPINEARAEIEKCALVCDYYADNARHFLKDEPLKTEAQNSFISHEPLGIVLAIMPWNFPFWQLFRFAAPALMAGNVVMMKHAPNVPQCACKIIEVFLQAGLESGIVQNLFIDNSIVATLIGDPRISAVTLTGSERAGSSVAMQAGKHIKRCVLELGGSDPFIVLDDANLSAAVKVAVKSRMINNGQSCIAAKRFIVSQEVIDSFMNLLETELKNVKMGDPIEETTTLGPLARADLRENLERQVELSVSQGAKVIETNTDHFERGYFFAPLILKDVKPGIAAFEEELFGPVFSITPFKTEDEAILLANQSEYGLGASIWTTDIEKGQLIARKIEAGCVFVNDLVRSDPRVPFGGIKKSGYGRELSHLGIKEFVNEKTVWIG